MIIEYINKKNKELSILVEEKNGFLIVDFLIKDKIQKTEYVTFKELEKLINVRDYKKVGTL